MFIDACWTVLDSDLRRDEYAYSLTQYQKADSATEVVMSSSVEWRRGFRPEVIANFLESSRLSEARGATRQHDGFRSMFRAFLFESGVAVLNSALELPRDTPSELVERAVFSAADQGRLSPQVLLKQVRKLLAEARRRPRKGYSVLGALSLAVPFEGKRRRVNGCEVLLGVKPRGRFVHELDWLSERYRNVRLVPPEFLRVRIDLEAGDPGEALKSACRAMDLLRSIWNLGLNYGRFTMHLVREFDVPVNQVLWLGPITVHSRDGTLAYRGYWGYPEIQGKCTPLVLQNAGKVFSAERRVRGVLSSSSDSETLADHLVDYCNALDTPNLHESYLSMWALLEKMTCGEKGAYDKAIGRALNSYAFSDASARDWHSQIAVHLRSLRNRMVHSASRPDEIEIVLHQLRDVVEHLLQFLIWSHKGFGGLDAALEFLDLPFEPKELLERRKLLTTALRLRKDG